MESIIGYVISVGGVQVFNESDSKLYTNFEYCEEVNHKHFTNMLIYKAKQFRMKKIPNKIYIF